MAAFDFASLVRGISGGITGGLQGKQEAEDRAREQQRLREADILAQMKTDETVRAGQAKRQEAADKRAATEVREQEQKAAQAQRAEFILNQLETADLERIKGFRDQSTADQLKTLEAALERKRKSEAADAASGRISSRQRPTRGGQLSVSAAFQMLKDRYAKFEDDGSGKLVFTGYEKSFSEMLKEARAIAGGNDPTPRPPEVPEIEEEEGPGFFKKLGQTIIPGGERGFLPPRSEAPSFSREETQQRAQELQAEGIPRDEILRIMQSEGYRVQ